MGNSIEGAIVFTAVLLLVTYLIVAPMEIVLKTIEEEKIYYDRVEDYSDNSVIYENSDHAKTSAERICTILTGLSDSYKIVYEGIIDSVYSFSKGDD